MDEIRIEIVEDNEINIQMMENILRTQEDFRVVGTARSGVEALENIREHVPDVVLLDIIMPEVDGMTVLEDIRRASDLPKQPKILMVTAVGKDDITLEAFRKGADYYIMKPFVACELVKHIRMTMQPQEPTAGWYAVEGGQADGFCAREKEAQTIREFGGNEKASLQIMLESDIMNIFARLGISTVAGGYRFLKEAVLMAVEDPGVMNRVTRDLYPIIAERHGATRENVERQMRRAIEVGWNRADLEAIDEYFGFTVNLQRGKPTNSEFIAQIADYIRLDYRRQGRLIS
jgi:two-component system response regulator (stage 0 sporulation protein A)